MTFWVLRVSRSTMIAASSTAAVHISWAEADRPISTEAPLVMADWAMLNSVASLPSAFWMVKSEDDRPAAVTACLGYGASNSTYRVEETVSGRITAMVPLPAETTGLRPAIAVKELLMSLREIDAAGALLVAGANVAGVEVVLLLL